MNQELTPSERITFEAVLVDHPELFQRCYELLRDFTLLHKGNSPKFLVVGSLTFEAIAYRYQKASPFNKIDNVTNAGVISGMFQECQIVVDPNLPPDYMSVLGTPLESVMQAAALRELEGNQR